MFRPSFYPSPVSFFGFLFIPTKEGSHLLTSIRPFPVPLPSPQLPLRHPKRMKVKRHKNNFLEVGVTDCQHGRVMTEEIANTKSSEWFCRKRSGIEGHHIVKVNILFRRTLCFSSFKCILLHSFVSLKQLPNRRQN